MRHALLTCLVTLSAVAGASPLQDAKRLVEDLEYAPALKLLDQLEKTEGNDAEALREIWLLQGISYGTLGKDAKTRDAFRKLLVVFPDTKLPADLPPRVRTPFFEAKEWASSSGNLSVTPNATVEGGKVTSLEVKLGPDVLRLARTARFHVKVDGAEKTEDVALAGGKATLALSGTEVSWSAQILSERKGVLLNVAQRTEGTTAKKRDEPVAETRPSVTPGSSTSTSSNDVVAQPEGPVEGAWRRPTGIALIGAGALAAGIGIYFGVSSAGTAARVTGAQRDESGRVTGLTQKDAASLEAQAHGQAATANVLFVTGGVLAAAGAVLTIIGPSGKPIAQVTPAGAGLSVAGTF
ncbi:MAG: hypothetical protein QM817_37995 [Archangium sp.]